MTTTPLLRVAFTALALLLLPETAAADQPQVKVVRLSDGGVQPRAVAGDDGTIHVVFLRGERVNANVFYMHSTDGGGSFSEPVQVNSQPGTAMTAGAVRAADVALGRDGLIHVTWVGSPPSGGGANVFHARGNGNGFEHEQLLRGNTSHIDGGSSIAADRHGHVYVVWHANARGRDEEAERRVWVAASQDHGLHFEEPIPADDEPAGACACCAVRAFCSPQGHLLILYRTARAQVNRDMVLLRSIDHAGTFTASTVAPLKVGKCVMSNAAFAARDGMVVAAWETDGDVWFAPLGADATGGRPITPPTSKSSQKHPVVAAASDGGVLLAWADGTSWNTGGKVGWTLFDPHGQPASEGTAPDLPAASFPAVVTTGPGDFILLY